MTDDDFPSPMSVTEHETLLLAVVDWKLLDRLRIVPRADPFLYRRRRLGRTGLHSKTHSIWIFNRASVFPCYL